jgi:hypothetical protein
LEKSMRKIINSAFVSLDGVTEDPSSWATFDPDSGDEAAQALQALDRMLMRRSTYEYFADGRRRRGDEAQTTGRR